MKQKRGTRAIVKAHPRQVQETDLVIGERIKGRRLQQKMSQDELGKILGVSFQQVQKYEKGANRLASSRLMQVAQALDCSVNDLIGGGDRASIKSTPFSKYANTKEGVQIITAMQKIPSPAVRRHVISLIETLSGHISG